MGLRTFCQSMNWRGRSQAEVSVSGSSRLRVAAIPRLRDHRPQHATLGARLDVPDRRAQTYKTMSAPPAIPSRDTIPSPEDLVD